jgi:hypothetical protein
MPAQRKQKQVKPRPITGRIEQEKDLIKWIAAARPFKKRDRDFWVTVIAISSIAGLVLFLIEGVMPVILIISLVFLFYILTTVEPDKIEYKITNRGIKIADKSTWWNTIRRYWFGSRFNSTLLIFETTSIPGRLELVINSTDKEKIKKVLKDYVLEEEASPSYMDRTANWFAKKLPGNK